MSSKIITFVIPTLGRLSLYHTIQSLQRQKEDQWKCILLFDGVQNKNFQYLKKDPRITILEIPKTGDNIGRSRAGLVRNLAFSLVDTEWIAFVDDDDTLSPYYITHLLKEYETYHTDVILFRMIYKNRVFLPPVDCTELKKCEVGISFALKTHLVQQDLSLRFQNDDYEDFLFLQLLLQKKHSILLSSYVTYYVKSQFFSYTHPLLTSTFVKDSTNLISKKRLFVTLQGGLGNLLFQICTGLHFSQMENRDVFFIYDISKKRDRKCVTDYKIFEYLLPSFISSEEWNLVPKRSIASFQEVNPFDTQDLYSFFEKNRDSEILYLKGYFQHIFIFESTLQHLLFISQKPFVQLENRKIAIHIRLGDDLRYPHIYLHLPNSYYEKALQSISFNPLHDQIILFTDDYIHLSEHYSFISDYPMIYAKDIVVEEWKNEGYQQDEIELMMMSQCDFLISANSTFSLWAGYLSQNTQIYIPSQYFSNENAYIPMSHFLHSQKDYSIISLNT